MVLSVVLSKEEVIWIFSLRFMEHICFVETTPWLPSNRHLGNRGIWYNYFATIRKVSATNILEKLILVLFGVIEVL